MSWFEQVNSEKRYFWDYTSTWHFLKQQRKWLHYSSMLQGTLFFGGCFDIMSIFRLKKALAFVCCFCFKKNVLYFVFKGKIYHIMSWKTQLHLIIRSQCYCLCVLIYVGDWVREMFMIPTTKCIQTGLELHLKCFLRITEWGQYFIWNKDTFTQ